MPFMSLSCTYVLVHIPLVTNVLTYVLTRKGDNCTVSCEMKFMGRVLAVK